MSKTEWILCPVCGSKTRDRLRMEDFGEKKKKELAEKRRELDRAKRVTQLTGLTPELVHEFIQKIVVSKPEYRGGKRYQGVEIYYNGVGIIREPSPEEMEEYFQEHLKRKPLKRQKRHNQGDIPFLTQQYFI